MELPGIPYSESKELRAEKPLFITLPTGESSESGVVGQGGGGGIGGDCLEMKFSL